MSVWQSIYKELNDPDFVIISAAQDTGGEAVAGPVFDAANPSYVQIVDMNHAISSAFNFVNVPSAAWVDETGTIVRVDEGTYAKTHPFGGTDAYAPAVKDWVRNGAASQYVQAAAMVADNIRKRTPEQEKAEAAFRLGNFFREKGHAEKAEHFWLMARTLHPDSINFFRQDLTLTEEGSAGESFMKFRTEFAQAGKDYYRPLDLE
mgnify:CR=1 FL=1